MMKNIGAILLRTCFDANSAGSDGGGGLGGVVTGAPGRVNSG